MPISFELLGNFEAVGPRHEKIDNDEIGLEAARGLWRSEGIMFLAHDVTRNFLKKQPDAVCELRVIVYN